MFKLVELLKQFYLLFSLECPVLFQFYTVPCSEECFKLLFHPCLTLCCCFFVFGVCHVFSIHHLLSQLHSTPVFTTLVISQF